MPRPTSCSAEDNRLASALTNVLQKEELRPGLRLRSDGFGKLDELLSLQFFQPILREVLPQSARELDTSGWGGPVPKALRELVDNAVTTSLTLEYYDPSEKDNQAVWLRLNAEKQSCVESPAVQPNRAVSKQAASSINFAEKFRCVLRQPHRFGVPQRSDGYMKLDELLSARALQPLIEDVAPGCSADLNTNGYGGPIPQSLGKVVLDIVNSSAGELEFWDPKEENFADLWVKTSQLSPAREQLLGSPADADGGVAFLTKGRVHTFEVQKGFGFLVCNGDETCGQDVFFHASALRGQELQPCEGRKGTEPTGPEVEFRIEWKNGKPRGVDLRILSAESPCTHASSERKENDDAVLSPELDRLSRALAALLRHRAEQDGVHIRSDGFAPLSDIISTAPLQKVIKDSFWENWDESGNGTLVSDTVREAVLEVVRASTTRGRPRFELLTEGETLFIRATHKHSLPNVCVSPQEDAGKHSKFGENGCTTSPPRPPKAPPPMMSLAKPPHTISPGIAEVTSTTNSTPNWLELLGDGRSLKWLPSETGQQQMQENSDWQTPASHKRAFPPRKSTPPPSKCDTVLPDAPATPPSKSTDDAYLQFTPPRVTAQVDQARATQASGCKQLAGRIKSFCPEKGFGFILSESIEGKDIFFQKNSVVSGVPERCTPPGVPSAATGQKVEFDLAMLSGKPRASNVVIFPGTELSSSEESELFQCQQDADQCSFGAATTGLKRAELANVLKNLPSDAPQLVKEYLNSLLLAR